MSSLNTTSTVNVSPPVSVVHLNDLLPRLNKPDDEQVGGAVGYAPVIGNVVPDGTAMVAAGTTVPSSSPEVVQAAPDTGSTAAMDSSSTSFIANSNLAILNRMLSAHMGSGGNGIELGRNGGSGGTSSSSTSTSNKKCPYHRQCSSHHHHLHRHQQHQVLGSSSAGGPLRTRYDGGSASSSSNNGGSPSASYPLRDAISTNVTPPPLNAVILVDRYLLMEPVEGNNLYRCYDIKSHVELVCKIANNPCSNLLTAHFRLDGHRHVNSLHKVIQGNNQTYLLYSPSEGDLHSYVRVRKRLREPEARRLCRQMCEVVKSCHEQGIVLRDLKLRKFVFADRERTQLKLESLEDAVVLDDPAEDLLQDKRGCPAYVSPEILRVNTTYSGKAADMWSLGVILYTMLVGRYPFNDSEHASLFAKISRGQFTVPECLSSKARCMIRALLRRDPEERIASEDVLHHPWLLHDDSKDHAYGLHAASRASTSSAALDDHCVPEWYDPSDVGASSASSSRMHYSTTGDVFDN
ncbi:tribbles homolog 2 [Anopheles stephensi]|uniref:tribbles homolog 2 n=1 Tax=Anopheles stephensi TaxID=30069 RepID=UPI0016589C8F|nr:tribbles homolog 2 [Anopheles stephensi]XP_035914787.1 tribbles homolog 2 [Anopheles stephensi]XP_035914788.1 tribbles homolog 2 [Anopheles stephensi]XP_035914789.1 tribbles homolog 2 [Anopheles stephensi]XP_035914790.1 tribbles homolog 2 [Anopheles stephensi]